MRGRRGSALVLTLGILTLLLIAGSAFLMLVTVESRASHAAGRGFIAECAARAGLAHAAYRVALAQEAYGSFNQGMITGGAWDANAEGPHCYFEKDADVTPLYDGNVWGETRDGEFDRVTPSDPGHACGVNARRIDLPAGWPAPPAYLDPKSKPVLAEADYAVALFALDGKLHARLGDCGVTDAQLILEELFPTLDAAGIATLLNTAVPSIGELQALFADAGDRRDIEARLTPYPVYAAYPPAEPPAVDINTAGHAVLLALANRMGLADPDKAVTAIETWRPFKTWGDSVDPNPLLGDLEDDTVQKALRREYSGDPDPDYQIASVKGGWDAKGFRFKFASRFWHVYVVGRARDKKRTRVRAVRHLHAVYDAEERRFLWMRWNQDFTKSNWNAP